MRLLRSTTALAACAVGLAVCAPSALAQRPQPTPEQRIDRLERQVQQVQRQVFPRGRPADTAGVANEPAATQSSVVTLAQRLAALERQMADILRQSEENGHRLQVIESDIGRLRADQERRIAEVEQRLRDALAAAPAATAVDPAATPAIEAKPTPKPSTTNGSATTSTATSTPAGDPGEDAYSEGFRLWDAGNYDAAITSLRAFTSAYPKHRRVSFANNLVGRALLDKGEARAAAEALLANYRNNPRGERAPDSLFYLGQALTRLGQPAQACKAYQELDAVYGSKVRADLRKLVDEAKANARC